MLPAMDKLLTIQIITTTTLITMMLLSSCCLTTESLPITSKPIESTAENLAWEAWLMVPVGQQQKSRKVTPKSIFIVPPKKKESTSIQCPPGEHVFESRCIPTVNIDTQQILLTQLTNLVLTSGDYDYDYDEEGNNEPGAEKLEGGIDVIPSSNGEKADEPLKFDIFRDNFPIGSSGSGDSSGSREPDDENVFFIGQRRRRPPTPPETVLPDLDTDSSSYGGNNETVEDGSKDEESTLFLSGIDAILVPAVSETTGKDHHFNVSIYPDMANSTTIADSEVEVLTPTAEKNLNLEQILENESLFLDTDHKLEEIDATTTERSESTTNLLEVETTTLKLEEDEDVESKTEFTRSVTEVAPLDEETTMTTLDPWEITPTIVVENEDLATSTIPSEETTLTEQISTTTNSKEDTTRITDFELEPQSTISSSTITSSRAADTKPLPSDQHLSENKPPIDIAAELKMINDLVARQRQPSTVITTVTPSLEAASKSTDLWTKIVPSPNSIASTASIPTHSTSNRSSSSTTSSTSDSQGSTQESFANPSSPPIPSTSPKPTLSGSGPLWWLPTGWRGERTDTDRPLLLRFWSAFSGLSGGQTKV